MYNGIDWSESNNQLLKLSDKKELMCDSVGFKLLFTIQHLPNWEQHQLSDTDPSNESTCCAFSSGLHL